MTEARTTTDLPPCTKGLVAWNLRERLWLLWHWLRLEFSDYDYACRRSMELRLRLPPSPQYRPSRRTKRAA